ECPGASLYPLLPQVAADVAKIGLPKIYSGVAAPDPSKLGADDKWAPVTVSARFTSPTPWTVTISDTSATTALTSFSGSGSTADVNWSPVDDNGIALPSGEYP